MVFGIPLAVNDVSKSFYLGLVFVTVKFR